MKKEQCYENYPCWIVFVSNFVSIAIYLIGAFIIYQIGLIWLILYLIFIGILEFRLIKGHCVNCYYYGKTCAFGKGKISSIFFKKGDVNKFCKKQMTWKDIVPDFMVSLIPMIIGTILLIINFDWILLALVLILFILTFIGNGIIRSQLACKYCKQRKLGCPAQQLFNKKVKK
ncbi:MAG: hypothetical protein NTV63_02885 [Candidatus Woesearchaeota archaeon]|nr:hypothetical protein [Candidatus Woesearchaeota archaeon]